MTIVEYNENWKKDFLQIKTVLERNLNDIIKIEHVGSTSINGMCAKPIIDIIIVIDKIENFIKTKMELEIIGYFHNGDQGINGREVFKKEKFIQNEILNNIPHHLYVCTKNNDEYIKELYFRDYLNENEEMKNEYYDIKKNIIEKIGNENREEYVRIKATEYNWFFEKIHKNAKKKYV